MDGKSCVSVAIGFIAAHYTKKTRSCGNAPYSVAVGFDDCGDELRDAVLDLAHKGGAHPKSRRNRLRSLALLKRPPHIRIARRQRHMMQHMTPRRPVARLAPLPVDITSHAALGTGRSAAQSTVSSGSAAYRASRRRAFAARLNATTARNVRHRARPHFASLRWFCGGTGLRSMTVIRFFPILAVMIGLSLTR